MFRTLLIEGNLGANENLNIPYNNSSLPLVKIKNLCKKALDSNDLAIKKLESGPLYEELIKVTEEAFEFVRMSKLKSEKEELNEVKGDLDDMNIEAYDPNETSIDSDNLSGDSEEDSEEDFV